MILENVDRYLGLLSHYTILRQADRNLLSQKLSYCPCSTKYHGSYEGGLLDHLLNVVNVAGSLSFLFKSQLRKYEYLDTQLLLCALTHDLGKMGNVESDYYLVNPDEKKRDKEPFIVNAELVSIPHEIRTLYWLGHLGLSQLAEEVLQAICYHAGPYTPGYMDLIKKEHPLLILLHSADNLAAKIMEAL